MSPVIYSDDHRYPGPEAFGLPDHVTGVPTQAELDAQPRLFTWGELKEVIKDGDLGMLSRNKELQNRYEQWMQGQRDKWGSTENYLVHARLPWGEANNRTGHQPEPTWDQRTAMDHPEVDLTPSTRPPKGPANTHRRAGSGSAAVAAHALGVNSGGHGASISGAATPGSCSHVPTAPSSPPHGSGAASGASTPSSVAYVSLDSVLPKINRKLERSKRRAAALAAGESPSPSSSAHGTDEDSDDDEPDVFLKYDPAKGLDQDKFAVLPNDWPYSIPYGVRHYCVWSRVPIAHPVLVDYDREAWNKVEQDGLSGFTGVIPIKSESEQLPTPPSNGAPAGGTGRNLGIENPHEMGKDGWYAIDIKYGGKDLQKWAGVQHESYGGHEVANMVRGLWDERGWETLWFVNPPRLQSVPGYAHFHVFARRKTPTEIDISEQFFSGPKPRAEAKPKPISNVPQTVKEEVVPQPNGETPKDTTIDTPTATTPTVPTHQSIYSSI